MADEGRTKAKKSGTGRKPRPLQIAFAFTIWRRNAMQGECYITEILLAIGKRITLFVVPA
jgi:hypothetical protein